MTTYYIILGIGILILFSFLLETLGKKIRLPSVLLFLLVGIILRQVLDYLSINIPFISILLPLFGTLGLLLIVLEGALDLDLNREKLGVIHKTFWVSIISLLFCTASITTFFYLVLGVAWSVALVNAVPLSIISSAVAIPSAESLPSEEREFVIYESSFSDILGVLLFNFLTAHSHITFNYSLIFLLSFLITILSAIVISLLLIWYLGKFEHHIKFLPIFAILLITYALAKIYHFSPLILILIFGLVLNNFLLVKHLPFKININKDILADDLLKFKNMSAEAVFFIKVMFFTLFGYSIEIITLTQLNSFLIALVILVIIISTRFVPLKLIQKQTKNLAFFSPRGLITVLLFLSLPQEFQIATINKSLIIWVIIGSILWMVWGVIRQPKNS